MQWILVACGPYRTKKELIRTFRAGSGGKSIYIAVDDVDAIVARAKSIALLLPRLLEGSEKTAHHLCGVTRGQAHERAHLVLTFTAAGKI